SGEYLQCDRISAFAQRPKERLSVAFWIKPAAAVRADVVSRVRDGVSLEWFVTQNADLTYSFEIWDAASPSGNGVAAVTTPAPITLGTWHHLAAVYDGTHLLIYLDGEPTSGDPFTGDIRRGLQCLQVGRSVDQSGASVRPFFGDLAELGLWNREL